MLCRQDSLFALAHSAMVERLLFARHALWVACTVLLAGTPLLGCARFEPSAGTHDNASGALYRAERQLTFAGRRSGEGYFDSSGENIVFQSERDPKNPFYQIYRMNLESGATTRISSGRGKTTCGWIDPGGAVLFASTHLDPDAESKQEKEFEARAAGKGPRYAWNYDPNYDLFLTRDGREPEQLTTAFGYDAEGSVSPDGRFIVFSSNRHAFDEALAPETREQLAENPSYFIDLYLLDRESGQIRRLTWAPGYDGGPFFSPDGERIVWRRFSLAGDRAEIHTIALDGTDEQVLTRLDAMSWAPFYHPSGDYIVFTTNLHGFDNFELYLVDAEGKSDPVRVTQREGFDGLPVFSPDGDRLLWTSNQTANEKSQLFFADWNDSAARKRLGLPPLSARVQRSGPLSLPATRHDSISPVDLAAHVRALTDDRTAGRRAGTPGEALASDYLARFMESMGLEAAGADGQYLHPFTFTSGISLGADNELRLTRKASEDGKGSETRRLEVDRDWRPLAFSRTGEIPSSAIVFVGYGLVAPERANTGHHVPKAGLSGQADHSEGGRHPDQNALDAYANLDLNDRWVMIFRDLPPSLEGPDRQHFQRYASLRYKAMVARDHGARGVLFVSGPLGRFRNPLVPLRFDASLAGTRIAVLSINDELAEHLLSGQNESLEALQLQAGRLFEHAPKDSDPTTPRAAFSPFEIDTMRLAARVDLEIGHGTGHNVLGRLQVGRQPSRETILLGAHYDHLGHGQGSASLASGDEVGGIHAGADDNASGVAVLLEIAEELKHRQETGIALGERDFVFAAWSGEELGLLGSARWVADHVDPHASDPHTSAPLHGASPAEGVVAYLNFDMVGRLRDNLVIQGLGSSPAWPSLLESAAAPLELSILPQNDSYLPTDATSFYTSGIPILSVFTGIHSEYHTPRDTIEFLNFEGATQIAKLGSRIAQSLSRRVDPPRYHAQTSPSTDQTRSGFRVFLGTVPDYAEGGVTGVRLTGVAREGPAEKAGLRGGDIIVEVDERPIDNLYDYTYALEALRVGEPASIIVVRDGERITLEIVPGSRD
jgi:Tol biopolymer transport system component